jgi:hypothetical protein
MDFDTLTHPTAIRTAAKALVDAATTAGHAPRSTTPNRGGGGSPGTHSTCIWSAAGSCGPPIPTAGWRQ